jgi:hypothetical protein
VCPKSPPATRVKGVQKKKKKKLKLLVFITHDFGSNIAELLGRRKLNHSLGQRLNVVSL